MDTRFISVIFLVNIISNIPNSQIFALRFRYDINCTFYISFLDFKIFGLSKDFTIKNGEFKSAKPTEGLLNYKLIFEKLEEYNLEIPIICEEINEEDSALIFKKLENIRKK